jgi:phage tail protein X
MAGTKSRQPVDFSYRRNDDDTWDSICLHCYMTVRTASKIEALAEAEAQHLCYKESPVPQNHSRLAA